MFNYRYETEREETARKARLPKGYKILSEPNPARNNFWHDIFNTILIDEPTKLEWSEGDQHFKYATKEEMEPKKAEDKMCVVLEVRATPYHARGYWFVPVYYYQYSEGIHHIRQCDLMFNNRFEALAVHPESVFSKNEQDLED